MHRGVEEVRGCKGARDGGRGGEGGGAMYVKIQGARAGELCVFTRRYCNENHTVNCSKMTSACQTVIHL